VGAQPTRRDVLDVSASAAGGPLVGRVRHPAELPGLLASLGLDTARPVLVSVGGAGGMAPEHLAATEVLLRRLVPVLERLGAAVVDGGTDSGVMQLMGAAFRAVGSALPLVGVAAAGTVEPTAAPDDPADPAPTATGDAPDTASPDTATLEPAHTHVVLVPGGTWGDESPWLARVASALAGGSPTATLVVNGGDITYEDARHSVAAGRPVVVVSGSGRTADEIAVAVTDGDHDRDADTAGGDAADREAAAVEAADREAAAVEAADGDAAGDGRAVSLVRSGLVHAVPLDDPDAVAAALALHLGGRAAD
jgi:hypothetical protein